MSKVKVDRSRDGEVVQALPVVLIAVASGHTETGDPKMNLEFYDGDSAIGLALSMSDSAILLDALLKAKETDPDRWPPHA